MTTAYPRRWADPRNPYRRWIDRRLFTLPLDGVTAYLRQQGWEQVPGERRGYLIFREPPGADPSEERLYQWLPDSESDDYALRLFEALTGIAEFEDRQASAIIDDILRVHAGDANGATRPQPPQVAGR